MRIVYGTLRNRSGPPIEGGITRGTPHLVAALNLTNLYSAFRAGLGFPSKQSCGGDFRRIARMLDVFIGSFQVVALGTRPLVAETTLPGGTQKSLTIGRRTWLYKGSSDWSGGFGFRFGRHPA